MPVLKRNDRVGEGLSLQRWIVVKKIGEGQFAEVYEVIDSFSENSSKRFALKIDRTLEVKTVRQEHKVLRRLQACPMVVRLVEAGTHEERGYMAMELLGMNVADSRKSCTSDGVWDAETAAIIGRHLLNAIAGMHQLGFIHRDIKPANFAITPRFAGVREGAWHVIDFGLARRYVDEGGLVLPARPEAAFRGSTTYASLAAHDGEDLGRRDDLWSWLYVMVEMVTGTLPWRSEEGAQRDPARQREQAVRLKRECLSAPEKLSMTGNLPQPLIQMSDALSSLQFESEPDYGFFQQCLDDLASTASTGPSGPLSGAHAEDAALAALADTPLSPPDEIADTPLSPPMDDQLDTPLSPPQEDQGSSALPPPRPAPHAGGFAAGMVNGFVPPARPSTPAASAAEPDMLRAVKRPRLDGGSFSPAQPQPSRRESDAAVTDDSLIRNASVERAQWMTPQSPSGSPADRRRNSSPVGARDSPSSRDRHRLAVSSERDHPERPFAGGAANGGGRSRSPYARSRSRSAERRTSRRSSRSREPPPPTASRETWDKWDREQGIDRRSNREKQRDAEARREAARKEEVNLDERRVGYKDRKLTSSTGRDAFVVDSSRFRHVEKYVNRIKQDVVSSEAGDCKAALKDISLTEGLGLAAYIIDKIVSEVSARDSDQMATLLQELEDFTYSQRQRARTKASKSK